MNVDCDMIELHALVYLVHLELISIRLLMRVARL